MTTSSPTTAQDVIDALRLARAAPQGHLDMATYDRLLASAPATDPTRPIGPVLALLTGEEAPSAN